MIFTGDKEWRFSAAYGKDAPDAGHMYVNRALLGSAFFRHDVEAQFRLIIHELGHHFGHHLESAYHEALCRIGAKLAVIAIGLTNGREAIEEIVNRD
jgi:hypothetical protein